MKKSQLVGWIRVLPAVSCVLHSMAGFGKATPGPMISDAVREAEDYYLGRTRLGNAQKALDLLRAAVQRNPQDYEAWWRISRTACYIARHEDPPENRSLLNEGVKAGKRAIAIRPNGVEGHFWLGANYGLSAEDGGFLTGLRLVDTVRAEMETVIRIDADYEQDAGRRLLARVYYRAPFFKGGDKRRSVELLRESLKRYPTNSLTMLYLADSLLALGRREEAREQLERILRLCPDPLNGPELRDNQAEARERLRERFPAGG